MLKCQKLEHIMAAFLVTAAGHSLEEQHKKTILENASLKESVILRIWRESVAHLADMKSA